MALITPAHLIALTDKLTAAYNAIFGSSASGYGAGDGTFGLSLKASDLKGIVQGSSNAIFADSDLETVLVSPVVAMQAPTLGNAIWLDLAGGTPGILSAMDVACRRASSVSTTIVDSDSFLAWYNFANAVTYWQCLAAPDWAWAFQALKTVWPAQKNCYYEVKQGVTYRGTTFTNALAKLVVGTGTTLGFGIDITPSTSAPAFAGGYCWANVSGMTGSGVLTVVGVDQSGVAETWTATITANGLTQLTPSTHAYSLVSSVTSVSAAVGITAGTIYVEAHAPTGRTNPPV